MCFRLLAWRPNIKAPSTGINEKLRYYNGSADKKNTSEEVAHLSVVYTVVTKVNRLSSDG